MEQYNPREHDDPGTRMSGDATSQTPTREAADERTRRWTFQAISLGDSHVKGEQSLCVGEAA